jgi:pyruvate formate lyase activating enzyme
VLAAGHTGRCGVRQANAQGLQLQVYGRASGLSVDPIEKKPLLHFLPGSAVLSFGTAGCNLTCRFCQNAPLSRGRPATVPHQQAAPAQIARTAHELGCRSVAFTYNEPLVFFEYAIDVAAACHELGLLTVAVTAGQVNAAPRAEFFRHMDAANVDLKAIDDRFYRDLCGASLAPVLETLTYLRHETKVWLEVTNLVIPGENDAPADLARLSQWVVDHLGPTVPLHFSAFHPVGDLWHRPPTPPATLRQARATAHTLGVRYAYTGNVADGEGSSTWCHACGALLIGRRGFSVTSWALGPEGQCPTCGAHCSGRFEARPGTWGGGRRSIELSDGAGELSDGA